MRKLLVTLCFALAACGGGKLESDPDARPDIIVVSIDSLRPDHLGAYGYARDTSPVFDRLAAEGILFRDVVSTSSWTLPAHAALFTGLFDSAHGLVRDDLALSLAHRTLAELLAEAGYRTGGFYGGPYLDSSFGLAQGFETWQSCMTRIPETLSAEDAIREARAGEGRSHADITGPRTLEAVRSWFEGADARPYFLFVHLWDVHYDYIPPPGYAERFDPDYTGNLDLHNYMKNRQIRAKMPARDLEQLIARYDGEIRFTDEILGRILDAADEVGRLEQALIVVTADHGDEFFEHFDKGHRKTLFEEVVRVPLVIRLPGGKTAGKVVDEQARIVDVLPTVLAEARIEPPDYVQGRNLAGTWQGGVSDPPSMLLELYGSRQKLRALRHKGHKLVASNLGRRAFYDLAATPPERESLPPDAPGFREAAQEMQRQIRESRQIMQKMGVRKHGDRESDSELNQRLKALGYLEE
jgi:arylsulfatase A-like enzyme